MKRENQIKNRFFRRVGQYIEKFVIFSCMFCLSGGMIGESSITAYAAGTSQATSESSSETSSDTKVEIGKATPASNYITAEDWPEGPSIGAEGAVLMEAETGTVLFAKNPDTQMYPASITKIMTALLTLEDSELTDTMVFEGEAFRELPANYTYYTVSEGEEWTIEDALCGLMMKSYNNVANALAVHDAGTIAAFAEKMNERAVQAGAKNTHFNNPSGEHEENHYTTPYDMAMIMRDCVQIEAFVDIAGRKVHTLQPTNKRSSEDTIYALHKMLFPSSEHYYEYCVCGKTGYTDQARNTLVTYAEKDGMKLICVVMGCGLGVQYADTETLFNFGFDNFSVIDASDSDERFTLKDEGIFASGDMASSTSFNIEIPEQSFVVLPSGVSLSKVDTNIQYLTDTEDGYFAEIDYLYEGMTVGSARLKMTDATPADGESFDFDSHAEQEESEAAESQGDGGLGDIWSRTKNIDVRVVIVEVVGIILIIAICIIRRIRKKDDRIRFDKKRKRRR